MQSLSQRLIAIEERIAQAARQSGREPSAITLVAVSKLQPVEKMQELLGLKLQFQQSVIFGENYVQEFEKKRTELSGQFTSHLIGPLQRNKAGRAVRVFDVIQSVHSEAVAEAIDVEARKIGKTQDIMLQVNISSDEAKSGFTPVRLTEFLETRVSNLKNIRVTGIMTIPRLYQQREEVRPDFQAMRSLAQRLSQGYSFLPERLELSMGMSDDFDIAIAEGATLVRIGTALFGERESHKGT